jgi:hypothetical protein
LKYYEIITWYQNRKVDAKMNGIFAFFKKFSSLRSSFSRVWWKASCAGNPVYLSNEPSWVEIYID